MDDTEKKFMVTDSCMWEAGRTNENGRADHMIEVVDVETGQVRYIKTGSIIRFVEGDISEPFTQEAYNQQYIAHEE